MCYSDYFSHVRLPVIDWFWNFGILILGLAPEWTLLPLLTAHLCMTPDIEVTHQFVLQVFFCIWVSVIGSETFHTKLKSCMLSHLQIAVYTGLMNYRMKLMRTLERRWILPVCVGFLTLHKQASHVGWGFERMFVHLQSTYEHAVLKQTRIITSPYHMLQNWAAATAIREEV